MTEERIPTAAYLEWPDDCIQDIPHVHKGPDGRCSVSIVQPGLWRLTRKDATIYSVQILSCGAWGGLSAYNSHRRMVWHQPSAFTGSFNLIGYCAGGIIFDTGYGKTIATNVTVNWREALNA